MFLGSPRRFLLRLAFSLAWRDWRLACLAPFCIALGFRFAWLEKVIVDVQPEPRPQHLLATRSDGNNASMASISGLMTAMRSAIRVRPVKPNLALGFQVDPPHSHISPDREPVCSCSLTI